MVVGLAVSAAAGCASSTAAPSGTTSKAAPTTTIDPAVLSAFMQPRIEAIPVGTYQNPATPHGSESLVIGEIGASYTELAGAGQRFQGTLSEDPTTHQVTFTNAAGAPCAHQPGVYHAVVAGRTLHLVPVTDPCAARAADFAAGTWTS